jgi:purine-nucleoside phosphorylase
MLKELKGSDLMGMLSIPEGRIPEALILWGTRNLKSRYATMMPFFENVLELGSPNGIIEDVLIGDVAGTTIAYASVYGASMASEVSHIFGVLGTRKVIQIGTCGGLADDLAAGDLFVAESAYCGEGAAQYYKTDGKEVFANLQFDGISNGSRFAASAKKGRIYTTSALFAEGQDDVERWAMEGFSAVDMETATTFAVAEHFGMERGSILVCFDNPRRKEHILIADEEKTEVRQAAQSRMVEIALAFGRCHAM